MVFDFNNLEDMLRDGVSADSIAQAFTKNLNSAIEAAKEGPTPLQEACAKLSEAWHYLVDACCDEYDIGPAEDLYVNPDTIEEFIPTAVRLLAATTSYMNELSALTEAAKSKNVAEPEPKTRAYANKKQSEIDDFEKLVNSFLK